MLMRNSQMFYVDDASNTKLHDLLRASVKKLGPSFGSTKEVDRLLWRIVCHDWSLNADQKATKFIECLGDRAKSEYTYICANQLFRIRSKTRRVAVGPVEIIAASDPVQDIFDGHVNPEWTLTLGPEYAFSSTNGVKIQLPQTCWKVLVQASQSYVQEDAHWMIDVAISLIRLSHEYLLLEAIHRGGPALYPMVGKTEPMPMRIPESETNYLLLTPDGISTGGMWLPPKYIIDDAVISAMQAPDFTTKAQAIFAPDQGSLAERVGQGLGWLTRGRQSEDRAERFLFFFTAIEALLSSDDKSAPVVQNVARNAAVILGNDVSERAENASRIKALYADRSALVHAGKRNVSEPAVNDAQKISEELYTRVLKHIPLNNSFSSFQIDLGRATYGLPWPLA